MLLERRVFDEAGLLRGASVRPPRPRQGQRARQEPERDGGQQGDDPGDEVAQPPGPHPAGVSGGDGDALCGGGSSRFTSPQRPFFSTCFVKL